MNPCTDCGQEHDRCAGHNNRGGPCGRAPIIGGNRCPLHGGSLPSVRARAIAREEERQARDVLSRRLRNAQPIEHPVYELLTLAAEMREWQHVLRERLDTLTELNLEDRQGVDRERALVNLYRTSLNDLGKLLVDMAKLDLAAKALTLRTEDAKRLMEAVTEALRRAGATEIEPAVRQHLRDLLTAMSHTNTQEHETTQNREIHKAPPGEGEP